MSANVSLQVLFLSTSIRTVGTRERLFPSVYSHVSVQIRYDGRGILAVGTLVNLASGACGVSGGGGGGSSRLTFSPHSFPRYPLSTVALQLQSHLQRMPSLLKLLPRLYISCFCYYNNIYNSVQYIEIYSAFDCHNRTIKSNFSYILCNKIYFHVSKLVDTSLHFKGESKQERLF